MCPIPSGDYCEVTISVADRDRYVQAIELFILEDDPFGRECDLRTLREMRLRLKRATIKQRKTA